MKWKMRQRVWISLIIAAALLILPVSSSYAASGNMGRTGAQRAVGVGSMIDPQYEKTLTLTADLSVKGSSAYAYASVTAKKICPITVTMRLQRLEGGSWVTKVSWVGSSNTGSKAMGRDYTLTQRGTYRTYAVFNVDGEQLTYKSATQVY